jgi:hypothetical protein
MARLHLVQILLVAALVAACAGCGMLDGSSSRDVDPKADAALKNMGDVFGKAEAMSFTARATADELLETGQLAQFSKQSTVLARRPDKVFVDTKGDLANRTMWYSGTSLTVLDKEKKTYAVIVVPGNIGDMLDHVVEEYDLSAPVADLLFGDPYKVMIANVEVGTYLGQHRVSKQMCHHLAFEQATIDWQIWIDVKTSLPRKLVIVHKEEDGQPTYTVTMDNWNLSPKATEDQFRANLPAGAKKVAIEDLLGTE